MDEAKDPFNYDIFKNSVLLPKTKKFKFIVLKAEKDSWVLSSDTPHIF